ncbi:MAG: hypothetical protein L0220_16350 [Acidobacteria bacterium]|nr:hypothetical protein [Acidobacteriota bacterium]
MNCREFENLVLDLARDQMLDPTMHEQSLDHTKVCERCAARLSEERALLAGVRAVVAALAREEAPVRVEKALLAAFREQTISTASPTIISMPGRIRHQSSKRWAAVAAGILVLISVMVIVWKSASSNKTQDKEHVGQPIDKGKPDHQVTPQLSVDTPTDRERLVVDQPKNQRKRTQVRRSGENSAETEVVTIFFILKEGEDLTAMENLSLVRIELPGSAISEMGIPIVLDTENERVNADVVLGQDGLARAIRFVAYFSDTDRLKSDYRTN